MDGRVLLCLVFFIGTEIALSITSVCVYCGSCNGVSERYAEAARAVATALAERNIRIIYGGGHVGLMGIVADTALKAGTKVIGIIPEHIKAKEVQHTGLTELHVVADMHTRKRMMVERSEAFVILPGGLGTLDEAFEILTWKKLHLHNKPVVLLNLDGYWDPFIALIDRIVAEGFATAADRVLFEVAATVPDVLRILDASAVPDMGVMTGRM